MPRIETVASPDSMRKNAAPSAPSLMTVSPAAKWRSLKQACDLLELAVVRSAKSGTR